MADEVSCRITAALAKDFAAQGHDPRILLTGLAIDLEHLTNRRDRIGWREFAQVLRNAATVWSREDFIAHGRSFVRSPAVRFISLVVCLTHTPRSLYFYLGSDQGPARQMFSCLRPSVRDTGPNSLRISIEVANDLEPCDEYFWATLGGMRVWTTLFGLPEADVSMERTARGAEFSVSYPPYDGLWPRLRNVIVRPYRLLQAGRELELAHQDLNARYLELAQSKERLATQTTQLRMANAIHQILHRDLDLERTAARVCEALCMNGCFAAAQMRLDVEFDGQRVLAEAAAGCVARETDPLQRAVMVRGEMVGTVRLWPDPDGGSTAVAHATEVLGHVMPAICMAVDNGMNFRRVTLLRDQMEQRVRERTQELSTAHARLSATVSSLTKAQQAKDRIFCNVNHDIRTPLSLIMLATQRIRAGEAAAWTTAAQRSLTSIDTNSRRLLNLVNTLLTLAAANDGKLRLKFSDFDVARLLAEISDMWQSTADSLRLTLRYRGPDTLRLIADRHAIERAVVNLVANAVKFTPPGGTIRIDLESPDLSSGSGRSGSGRCVIAVRDSGIGLPTESPHRIFERFEQVRRPVHPVAEGTGLGLSLVKELVEAHAGQVRAESIAGGGSAFILDLPLVATHPTVGDGDGVLRQAQDARVNGDANEHTPLSPAAIGFVAPPADSNVERLGGGPTDACILLAEDDPSLRRELGDLLANEYNTVLLAADGEQALQLAKTHCPHLLVCDVVMPGISGIELAHKFRESMPASFVPIVFVSAYEELNRKIAALSAGGVDYIVKPFHPEEFLARIRAQLSLRTLAVKLHECEQFSSLGLLAASLTHELRDPMNSLVNAVEPLAAMLPSEVLDGAAPTGQLFAVIRDRSRHLRQLVNDLLDYRGPRTIHRTKRSTRALVEQAIALVDDQRGGVHIETQIEDTTILCSRTLLLRALVNLIDNAVDAAGAGGWVKLRAWREEHVSVLEISDSGPGIDPRRLPRLFEPFFTTKAIGKGTGLGLHICRCIVEQHGGTVSARNAQGPGGAIFRVELPVAADDGGA